jgi:glycosyltransferase involved in cell wall biosynthesis
VNITIISHYFWPEISAPSSRLLDMAKAWTAAGHRVTVVTNFPSHPTGIVPAAYRGKSFLIEQAHGLRIIRCRTYATANRGFVRKTAGHLVFMASSVAQAASALAGTEVLIASSPTLFSVVSAWVLSRRLGAPFVFEVRDLWPAIFAELGVIRSRPLLRAIEGLEVGLYRRSAAVVTVTRSFAAQIVGRGIDQAKVHVIPNGVDLELFAPGPQDSALWHRLGLDGKFVVLYCGAHGISHALGRVLQAALLLHDRRELHFLFVGEGAEKAQLREEAEALGLTNVTFLPGVERDQVPAFYRSAEVCLVPLRRVPLFRSFVPSKMFEIMACGRPILGAVEGEAAEILAASGAAVLVPPEDSRAIADAIHRLASEPALRAELAARGRPYAAAHYDRRALASDYAGLLERLVVASRSARARIPRTETG